MKSCLVVDDSRVIRTVARRILEELDFGVREAADGQEAIAACREEMPDAILLDWNMPVMNGIEFLRILRTDKKGAEHLHLCDELVAELVRCGDAANTLRLRHKIGRTHVERPHRYGGVAARKGRRHKNFQAWLNCQKLRQCVDTGKNRHVDVENDDLSAGWRELTHGLLAVGDTAHNLDLAISLEPTREKTAHNRRVVRYHHAIRPIAPRWR